MLDLNCNFVTVSECAIDCMVHCIQQYHAKLAETSKVILNRRLISHGDFASLRAQTFG